MPGLISRITQSLTTKHVPESGDTSIATQSMGTSASALALVAKGNKDAAKTMVLATTMAGKKTNNQQASDALADRVGAIKAWMQNQELIGAQVDEGAKYYKKGINRLIKTAETIGDLSRDVAISSAQTQDEMNFEHRKASAQVRISQEAYSGGGFSA